MSEEQSIELLNQVLKKRKLKLTRPRRILCEHIVNKRGHFTVDELWEEMKKSDSTVSKATIYRTVSILVEGGLLEEHNFETGQKHYEYAHDREHHDHMFCMQCSKIIEFQNQTIEDIQSAMAKKFQFKPLHHTLKIYGLCKDCR